jgi:hypothetical protein
VVTTKYCPANVALLLLGVVVALADVWLAVMTLAFGADPVHDLRSGMIAVVLWASMTTLAACLITLKLPNLGAIVSWSVVALCRLSVWASSVVILFMILAAVEGAIAVKIASRSERNLPITLVPK